MKRNIIALFSAVILSSILAIAVNAQTGNSNSTQNADKKLKITKKTTAKPAGCRQSSGLAVIKVTFDKSGKITATEIVRSSGCGSFDKNALAAARRIEFEPEIKNGEAVTVAKPVEYRFERY